MKSLFIAVLAFSSISAFASSSIDLMNKNGEKIAELSCSGKRGEEANATLQQVLENQTVKDIVSTGETIKINLNENKASDGTFTDSIELEKTELDKNELKCKVLVEL